MRGPGLRTGRGTQRASRPQGTRSCRVAFGRVSLVIVGPWPGRRGVAGHIGLPHRAVHVGSCHDGCSRGGRAFRDACGAIVHAENLWCLRWLRPRVQQCGDTGGVGCGGPAGSMSACCSSRRTCTPVVRAHTASGRVARKGPERFRHRACEAPAGAGEETTDAALELLAPTRRA